MSLKVISVFRSTLVLEDTETKVQYTLKNGVGPNFGLTAVGQIALSEVLSGGRNVASVKYPEKAVAEVVKPKPAKPIVSPFPMESEPVVSESVVETVEPVVDPVAKMAPVEETTEASNDETEVQEEDETEPKTEIGELEAKVSKKRKLTKK